VDYINIYLTITSSTLPKSPSKSDLLFKFQLCVLSKLEYLVLQTGLSDFGHRTCLVYSLDSSKILPDLFSNPSGYVWPPHSPIASVGEESHVIESFEERIAHFDIEPPMQQWYGDATFSGFSFDYGGTAGASSSHPPPFDFPPLAHARDDGGEESREQDEDDE
jgi:hypothetical protein